MNFFGKSYNKIESELNDTKNKVLLLEEKINELMKALEDKCKKNTTSLISFTDNNSSIKFIDINCTDISIVYSRSFTSKSGEYWQRFSLNFDNVQINSDMYIDIQSKIYTFESIYKIINELKNIRVINFKFISCIVGENDKPSYYLRYFRGHFDILKKLTAINNGVKIILVFQNEFPFEWLKYIFNDLITDNILEIEIIYSYSIDKYGYMKNIINGLNKEVSKKIIFKFKKIC